MKKILIFFIFSLIFLPVICLAEQIDINSATLSQLDELTGIGPTYAQRIIDGRPFSSVDDLLRVKGIGPATLQKIKTQGLACVNCQPTQASQNTPPNASTTGSNSEVVNNTTPAQNLAPEPNTSLNNSQNEVVAKTYPGGIFINEIVPNPQGPDGTDEWIELYNSNNFDVDLSGWQIQDTRGTITTFTIPQGTEILSSGFKVFKRPETNIMLNNDADGLNLLTPDKKIVDSINFTDAPLGQSYNKNNSSWTWSTTATPGAINIITAVAKAPKVLSKTDNSVTNNVVTAGLVSSPVAEQAGQTINPWLLFFIVLIVTIILGVVVLIIKLKFSKQNVRT